MSRDYVIPSNVKVGYLMRMLLRRSFRAMDAIGFKGELIDIIDMQFIKLRSIIPDFPRTFLMEIIGDEREKYRKSLESGKEIVLRMLRRKGTIDLSDLELLYDSHGLIPEFVAQIALNQGVNLRIPMTFHENIVNSHDLRSRDKDQIVGEKTFSELETRTLYYDDPRMMEFTAIVLGSSGNLMVPNQTCFYATGGGQPHDTGYFKLGSREIQVLDVYREGNAIVHRLSEPIAKGIRLHGFVDVKRRKQLMIHHSATHLLLGTLRKVLGDQVWQAGVQKGVESSRLDITYNKPIQKEQISEIENLLMKEIGEEHKIIVRNMDWNVAIRQYGFRLFEGGAPLNKKLRVVEIEGIDVEGCGGTHVRSTCEIGFIKILGIENIQESIYRFIFAAGPAALKKVQENWDDMDAIRAVVRAPEDIVMKVKKTVEELIALRKKLMYSPGRLWKIGSTAPQRK
jgi:Alanyl-tRNA synthetase